MMMLQQIKNLFAVTGAIVTQTAKGSSTPRQMAEAILGRLGALAAAHAECGDSKEAVRLERRALELGYAEGLETELARKRLRLYEAGKPLRL